MEKEESQRSKVDTWIRENEEAFIKADLEPSVEVTKTGSFAVFVRRPAQTSKETPKASKKDQKSK